MKNPPEIDRNPQKQMWTAKVQICANSDEHIDQICEKIRYFEIDGKECRALKEFGYNIRNSISKEAKIFVSKIPLNMKQK